ncbi:MAG: citrate synthase/methylcitrate synthase [Thermoplasmata archaeon]|nr:citrate synthase/methylcitrate synthase [Thermoplasmata archaeon]
MSAPSKGLEQVVLGRSAITLVAGETGGLVYRGFPIQALVPGTTYESIVHLFLQGTPPAEPRPESVRADLAAHRVLSPEMEQFVDRLSPDRPPLDALRTMISALGDARFGYPATEAQGRILIGAVPTMLARYVQRQRGGEPVPPSTTASHAEDYLHMITRTAPPAEKVHALEDYLVLLADHGMNASTFALRVVLSTNSDLISAATAALGALKGPAHGGAPSKVSDMLDAVADPSNAENWIRQTMARGERLFGFGHRAYKTEDPRGILLHRIARQIADPRRLALAEAVEVRALEALAREKPGRRLYTNVEFYSAVVLESVGLPRELFTPTFAVARTVGWAAHALEQVRDNRLIRPDTEYTGRTDGAWPLPRGWDAPPLG